jgi:hypothetical protein
MPFAEPNPLDDEMGVEQYLYPPGLMPEAEMTFSSIEHDEHYAIYADGEQSSTILKSDTTVDIEP